MSDRHTVEEARDELISARTFQRQPAEWAVAMAEQVRRVDEAAFDDLDDVIMGSPYLRGGDPMEARFREAGLCEESARQAAKGLREGLYFSFEDAAIAQTTFDRAGRPRNTAATPRRIAEVARIVEGDSGAKGPGVVSESDLDALDDAIFGKPGQRRWGA